MEVPMRKPRAPVYPVLILALFMLMAIPSLSFAPVVKCGCYCGKTTDPPCSEDKCKQTCGWRGPSGGVPSYPAYDAEAERQRQIEAERQRLEAERQRQEEIEEQRKKVEADAKLRQEKFEHEKQNALSSMKGIPEGELGLKNIDTGGLGLKDLRSTDAGTLGLKEIGKPAGLNKALKEEENKSASNDAKQNLIKKQEARVAGLLQEMKVDQQAIRTLGLYDPRDPEKRARDFEEWAKLADEARIEFEKEYMEDILAAVEAGVAQASVRGAGAALKPVKSLNPYTVNTQIKWLKSTGLNGPDLFHAMRAIAKTPGKPELAEKILGRLHMVVELGLTPDLQAGREGNSGIRGFEQMDGLAAVLGVIDSKYKVLAADFRFMASAFYNNATRRVSQDQVDSLTKLAESQLKLLLKYNKRIRDHGNQLREARTELARLSQGAAEGDDHN
jgi:hypothetical protein